jgi:hypothetical protein
MPLHLIKMDEANFGYECAPAMNDTFSWWYMDSLLHTNDSNLVSVFVLGPPNALVRNLFVQMHIASEILKTRVIMINKPLCNK